MPRPADPTALRRDRPGDRAFTQLTARPDDAVTPDWPLTDPTPRELELWEIEWRRPQANEWEKNDEVQAVALFVRLLARAEAHDAPVTVHKYVREYRAELGISANGAAHRRWLMPTAAAAVRPAASVTSIRPGARRQTARERFTVKPPPRPDAADTDPDPAPF